jgi:ferredoxin
MTHVVIENCVSCKFTDCVLVCPVDCFYETETQLVIDPDECIDCSACVAECPVEAIYAEDEIPDEHASALEQNAEVAQRLKDEGVEPITDQKDPLPTAEDKRAKLGF